LQFSLQAASPVTFGFILVFHESRTVQGFTVFIGDTRTIFSIKAGYLHVITLLQIHPIIHLNRTEYKNGNMAVPHLERTQFEFKLKLTDIMTEISVVFLSISRRMPRTYLETDHNRLILHPSQFTVHNVFTTSSNAVQLVNIKQRHIIQSH
jgi:hypothetical protein